MRRFCGASLLSATVLCFACAFAQEHSRAEVTPFELVQTVCQIPQDYKLRDLSEQVRRDLAKLDTADAVFYFCLAERMERLGDYRAPEFYEKAIQTDPTEPNYDLFYGDYLRNIRGAFI